MNKEEQEAVAYKHYVKMCRASGLSIMSLDRWRKAQSKIASAFNSENTQGTLYPSRPGSLFKGGSRW